MVLGWLLLLPGACWAQWKCACQESYKRLRERWLRTFKHRGILWNTCVMPNCDLPFQMSPVPHFPLPDRRPPSSHVLTFSLHCAAPCSTCKTLFWVIPRNRNLRLHVARHGCGAAPTGPDSAPYYTPQNPQRPSKAWGLLGCGACVCQRMYSTQGHRDSKDTTAVLFQYRGRRGISEGAPKFAKTWAPKS